MKILCSHIIVIIVNLNKINNSTFITHIELRLPLIYKYSALTKGTIRTVRDHVLRASSWFAFSTKTCVTGKSRALE